MKNTKRSLFMSVLSMLLCIAMLAGSTFAWFTDSVTSGKNTIVAGNLDVELYHAKDFKDVNGEKVPNYEKVNEKTPIFDEDALWEPGRVEVVYLKVENAGTLALKYALGINEASFNDGLRVVKEEVQQFNEDGTPKVDEDGKQVTAIEEVEYPIHLAKYIKFAIIEGIQAFEDDEDEDGFSARQNALAAADKATQKGLISELTLSSSDVLYPKGAQIEEKDKDGNTVTGEDDKPIMVPAPDSKAVTLILYMEESVSNVANYRFSDADKDKFDKLNEFDKLSDKEICDLLGLTAAEYAALSADEVKEKIAEEIESLEKKYIPTIDLGVNLVATQTPYEEDSFDKDYDKNAPLPLVFTSITNAIEQGAKVANEKLAEQLKAEGLIYFDEELTPELDGAQSVTLHFTKEAMESDGIDVGVIYTITGLIEDAVKEQANNIQSVTVGVGMGGTERVITKDMEPNWLAGDLITLLANAGNKDQDTLMQVMNKGVDVEIKDMAGGSQIYRMLFDIPSLSEETD